jgi:hypothetical protein
MEHQDVKGDAQQFRFIEAEGMPKNLNCDWWIVISLVILVVLPFFYECVFQFFQ